MTQTPVTPICLTAPTRHTEPRWGLVAAGRLLPGDWPTREEAQDRAAGKEIKQ